MKLQHIRQSLEEIKNDDLIIIEELKSKIRDLEQSLNKKYVELDEIETRKNIINNLMEIKTDKKKFLRVLRPFIEFIFMGIILFLTIITVESLSMLLIFLLCFILGLLADALNIIHNDYSKITKKNDFSFKSIVKAFCHVFMKRDVLSINMDECLLAEENISQLIREMEQKINMDRSAFENLKEEMCYIDGTTQAINCVINAFTKYNIDEYNQSNSELVQFIENKKNLKKSVNSDISY